MSNIQSRSFSCTAVTTNAQSGDALRRWLLVTQLTTRRSSVSIPLMTRHWGCPCARHHPGHRWPGWAACSKPTSAAGARTSHSSPWKTSNKWAAQKSFFPKGAEWSTWRRKEGRDEKSKSHVSLRILQHCAAAPRGRPGPGPCEPWATTLS